MIQFTPHARTRMRERGISDDEVLTVLSNPFRVVEGYDERREVQGLVMREGKQMLLRVIVADGVVLTVITVMLTSQLQRYGVSP
jgi:Domain of unknown function (DUF4258)